MNAFIKKYSSILLMLVLYTTPIISADQINSSDSVKSDSKIEGVWEGTLNAQGVKLRLVVNIVLGEDGKLKAEMDSPDQGATGIQVDEIRLNKKVLYFEIKSIGGNYKGTLSEDGNSIDGTWSQGSSFPLLLKKDPTRKPREIKERTLAKVDPAIYKEYTGRYQITPNFILTVSTRDNRLFVQATAQPQLEVFPESETKFFYKAVNAQITFVKDESGVVNKLILHQNGRNTDAPKLDK